MREFEISIKSAPHGAQVHLEGYTKDLIKGGIGIDFSVIKQARGEK